MSQCNGICEHVTVTVINDQLNYTLHIFCVFYLIKIICFITDVPNMTYIPDCCALVVRSCSDHWISLGQIQVLQAPLMI